MFYSFYKILSAISKYDNTYIIIFYRHCIALHKFKSMQVWNMSQVGYADNRLRARQCVPFIARGFCNKGISCQVTKIIYCTQPWSLVWAANSLIYLVLAFKGRNFKSKLKSCREYYFISRGILYCASVLRWNWRIFPYWHF